MCRRRKALLALGILRLVTLQQKESQIERARKAKAYLKMTRALKTDFYRLTNLRMDEATFFKLLGLVRPIMQTQDDTLEEIDVLERLFITLKYLATGCSLEELTHQSELTDTEVLESISVVCAAVVKALKEYIKLPKEEKEWLNITDAFEKKWNFSHCAGAFSARHIPIDEPLTDGGLFLNHKGTHSILVIAVVNANYEFVFVEVGLPGGHNKEWIYQQNYFFEQMIEDSMQLPKDSPLPGTDMSMPYVFVADTDYVIENIMRPYSLENISFEEKIFNYRFFRAKRVADNAFGIMFERFGVLRQNIYINESNVNSLVMACFSLHNYLAKTNEEYISKESLDVEDAANYKFQTASWRLKRAEGMSWSDTHPLLSVPQGPEEYPDSKGKLVRENFTKYFNNEAKLPFQEQMVNVVPELNN